MKFLAHSHNQISNASIRICNHLITFGNQMPMKNLLKEIKSVVCQKTHFKCREKSISSARLGFFRVSKSRLMFRKRKFQFLAILLKIVCHRLKPWFKKFSLQFCRNMKMKWEKYRYQYYQQSDVNNKIVVISIHQNTMKTKLIIWILMGTIQSISFKKVRSIIGKDHYWSHSSHSLIISSAV